MRVPDEWPHSIREDVDRTRLTDRLVFFGRALHAAQYSHGLPIFAG